MNEKDETSATGGQTEPVNATATGSGTAETDKKADKKEDSFFVFLLKLAVVVLIFRSFIFSPFSIPSESMLPGLQKGDYLLAAKWPYGFSRYSLPLDAPLIPGRIFASQPERGDVVIFKHPIDKMDYIKRVIGLPGDSVAMRAGQLIINGEPIPKERIEDFTIAVSPNTDCAWGAVPETDAEGAAICRYAQFRETLPSEETYEVLDFGPAPKDNYGPIIVPEGQLFVMGDNRDNSQDSRFTSEAGGGVGLLPQELLVGRATIIMWSTDGSSSWLLPWTWFTAARWGRLGNTL